MPLYSLFFFATLKEQVFLSLFIFDYSVLFFSSRPERTSAQVKAMTKLRQKGNIDEVRLYIAIIDND